MNAVARTARDVVVGVSPVLLAARLPLSSFVANAIPITLLWRPLVVALLVALVIQLVLVRILGWTRGSFWASVAVAALSGLFILAGAMVLALTILGAVRSAPGREYVLANILAATVSLVLVLGLAAEGAAHGAFTWTTIESGRVDVGHGDPGPSVHVLLLDGYPRDDTLRQIGLDNSPFLAALRDRGFDVYSDSYSNYDRTPFSLLSILSMQQLTEIPSIWPSPLPATTAEQERITARALLDPAAFTAFESRGYSTRALAGSVAHVPLGGADATVTALTANNYELDLLQNTPLAGLLEAAGFAVGQQRSQITRTLDAFARPPEAPSFTFAHVLAPHAPFVFAGDGSAVPAPPCYPERCAIFDNEIEKLGWTSDEYWDRFTGQVTYLNGLVIEAIDRLVETDPDGVVVLVSDHGARIPGDDGSMFRNFLAARTPGHPELFGPGPTPVNILPSILNAYLSTDIALSPDTIYEGGTNPWLAVRPVLGEP